MKTSIEKTFRADEPIEKVWEFLKDLTKVIPCLPGASITQQIGMDKFKGKVSLRFGPVLTNYHGEVFVEKLDAENRGVHLVGKGLDAKGNGTADVSMNGKLNLLEGEGTEVNLNMDIEITGTLALLGSGLIYDVVNEVVNQFIPRFKDELAGKNPDDDSLDGFTLMEAAIKGFFNRLFRGGS